MVNAHVLEPTGKHGSDATGALLPVWWMEGFLRRKVVKMRPLDDVGLLGDLFHRRRIVRLLADKTGRRLGSVQT